MSDCKSCVGCKFLYLLGSGYSNYTWECDYVCCALNLNDKLGSIEKPFDWKDTDPAKDNWPATMNGRCERYAPGERIHLDVDGDDDLRDEGEDFEALVAVLDDSKRALLGRGYTAERWQIVKSNAHGWIVRHEEKQLTMRFDTDEAATAYVALMGGIDHVLRID